jgi:NitT/TauT family transport system ATP-binding protein
VSAAAPPGARGLVATGISKQFSLGDADIEALSDIDFDEPAGSFTALLGPSGCGKSTLLRLFAGLETPTSGEIRLHGRTADAMRRQHRIGG